MHPKSACFFNTRILCFLEKPLTEPHQLHLQNSSQGYQFCCPQELIEQCLRNLGATIQESAGTGGNDGLECFRDVPLPSFIDGW